MIHTGDCVEVMAGMEPESVDAIVTERARLRAAIAERLSSEDDLYPCPECTSPDGPCVDLERVRQVVDEVFA